MTINQFAKECQRHIDAGHEFIAYWHPQGFMLLRQGVIQTTVYRITVEGGVGDPDKTYTANSAEERDALLRYHGHRVKDVKPKTTTKKVKASAATKMRKIIDQLKKQRGIGSVCTVEYVGGQLLTEGEADALHSLRIPENSH